MTWTNADYRREPTAAARLAKLDLYLEEIDQRITANVAKGGSSRQVDPLLALRAQVDADRRRLASEAARETRGGIRRGRFLT